MYALKLFILVGQREIECRATADRRLGPNFPALTFDRPLHDQLAGAKLWGATAMVVAELLAVLRASVDPWTASPPS